MSLLGVKTRCADKSTAEHYGIHHEHHSPRAIVKLFNVTKLISG